MDLFGTTVPEIQWTTVMQPVAVLTEVPQFPWLTALSPVGRSRKIFESIAFSSPPRQLITGIMWGSSGYHLPRICVYITGMNHSHWIRTSMWHELTLASVEVSFPFRYLDVLAPTWREHLCKLAFHTRDTQTENDIMWPTLHSSSFDSTDQSILLRRVGEIAIHFQRFWS